MRADAGSTARIDGRVDGTSAEVMLELAAPISSVTEGCFRQAPPGEGAPVSVRAADGSEQVAPLVTLDTVVLGDRRLKALRALRIPARACLLSLGIDVLGEVSMTVDPKARTVSFGPAGVGAPAGSSALELSRDPGGDWPVLVAVLAFGRGQVVGPFVVSTATRAVRLSPYAMGGAPASVISFEQLALRPGLTVKGGQARIDPEQQNPGAVGVLGADVWERFVTTFDPQAGLIHLQPLPASD